MSLAVRRAAMGAVCRLSLVCLLCALWGGAVMADDLPPAVRWAVGGVANSTVAVLWQDGVAGNATELLTALEEASKNITAAEKEAGKIKEQAVKGKVKKAVDDLKSKTDAAIGAAKKVKDMEGKVLEDKKNDIEDKDKKLMESAQRVHEAPEGGGEKEAAALKTAAEEAASLWESLLEKIATQLAEVYSASNATHEAKQKAEEAEKQLGTEGTPDSDENVKNTKDKLEKAKVCLEVSVQKASLMVTAAETVSKAAHTAVKAFNEAAKLASPKKDPEGTTGKTEEAQSKENNTGTSTTGLSGDGKNDRDASDGNHITAWTCARLLMILTAPVYAVVC